MGSVLLDLDAGYRRCDHVRSPRTFLTALTYAPRTYAVTAARRAASGSAPRVRRCTMGSISAYLWLPRTA